MTKKNALERAIAVLSINENDAEAVETLQKMIDALEKARTPMSDEKKAELATKRHEATVAARTAEGELVIPVLSKYLAQSTEGYTAKGLFEAAQNELPVGFSWNKVQNYLIRELAPKVEKIEVKGKPNTYVWVG